MVCVVGVVVVWCAKLSKLSFLICLLVMVESKLRSSNLMEDTDIEVKHVKRCVGSLYCMCGREWGYPASPLKQEGPTHLSPL